MLKVSPLICQKIPMKHSRFLAAATATTVALTTVVPAHAAQIGPLDQNKCTLTLSTAELDRYISLIKRSQKFRNGSSIAT